MSLSRISEPREYPHLHGREVWIFPLYNSTYTRGNLGLFCHLPEIVPHPRSIHCNAKLSVERAISRFLGVGRGGGEGREDGVSNQKTFIEGMADFCNNIMSPVPPPFSFPTKYCL